MSDTASSATAGKLSPVTISERIQALDVIRGFALIGIFLMNVEWFTRPLAEFGRGVDVNQHGLSYLASWCIYTLVQGKFWTMFSLLFGMGFAVMLTDENGGRAFVTPYVRRIIALFLFGCVHYVMIWPGDILHVYAPTALALLLIVTRSWKAWFAILLSVAASGFAFGPDAWWTAGEFPTTGLALALLAVLMFFLSRGSLARFYKFGVALYVVPFVVGLLFVIGTATIPAMKPVTTAGEAQQRTERLAQQGRDRTEEVHVYTEGSYLEAVRLRAKEYADDLPGIAGASMMTVSLFLIGFWFVRSGVIANLRENLGLFRRLAAWTLPLGLGITLLSVWMHPSFVPGNGRIPSVAAARLLFEIGALPLCIGYVSALICLLGTGWGARLFAPLRYAGRMALTNYLGASVISTLYFYGYGLGHFGQVSRAGQVVFVFVVFSMQLLVSYLWLSRFRYGPMEWLWRAITYWQLPAMRRESEAVTAPIATPTASA